MITYGVEHSVLRITRAQAKAMGMTHEGTHFGIPVYCREMKPCAESGWEPGMDVLAEHPGLDWWLTVGGHALAFVNMLRPVDDPIPFGFEIKPIEGDA